MNTLQVRNYEIKNARNKEKIPVVNGVHLHSSYDPSKEAFNFVERHTETLKTKNEVLVLGLGFGYHVNEIIKILADTFGNNFSVVVIEPNNQIYQDCMKEELIKSNNVKTYTGTEAKDYYCQPELIKFLLRKPAVIAHPASFNLNQLFFKSFLSYESPRTISKLQQRISSPEIQEYLANYSPDATLDNVAELVFTQNAKLQELDFLLLAMKSMTSSIKKDNQQNGDN